MNKSVYSHNIYHQNANFIWFNYSLSITRLCNFKDKSISFLIFYIYLFTITSLKAIARMTLKTTFTIIIFAVIGPISSILIFAQSDGCDSSYPDMCISSPPPDLDCGDISEKNFRVLYPDPHKFDRDEDGIGCES